MSVIKFGTDGWRAIIAEDFTFSNVELVAKGIASYIKEAYTPDKPAIVGYDTRFLADKFAERAAKTLNNCGLNVLMTESYAPTPVIALAARNLETAGALVFTASHNPAEYCGIKYVPHYAGPATQDITDKIVHNIHTIENNTLSPLTQSSPGNTTLFSPKKDYFQVVSNLINFSKIQTSGFEIYYDPMYATGLGYMDELLRQNNCQVTVLHDHRDPLFGNSMPEPNEKHLPELITAVKQAGGKAIGFGTDGDADRFAVIDETGQFIHPNLVISILVKHLVENKGAHGSIVRSLATTHAVDIIARKMGLTVHETPVGFKHIGAIMRQEDVIVGGEESGGLSIYKHIPEKDGIVANLSILEAVAYYNKPVSQLVEDIKQFTEREFFNTRLDLKVPQEKKDQLVQNFKQTPPQSLAGLKLEKTSTIDGCKLYFENDNWILIRPSGTEPLLRVYFEAGSDLLLKEMVHEIHNIIQ